MIWWLWVRPRGFVALEPIAGAADREALVVQQRADLANHQDVLALVVATVTRRLTGFSWGNSCSQ